MFRAIPVSNRILSKKWEEKNQAIHKKKLNDMKSIIDSKRPASFAHLKRRAKKEQMLEDRYTEIERENRILLEKMSQIMQNKNMKARITKPIQKKSLNNESRKRQLIQITMENQAILKRLQDKQSSYNVVRWEEDRKLAEKRLKNMCEYPYRLGVTQEGRRNPSIDMKLTGRIATSLPVRQTQSMKKTIPRKLEPLIRDSNRPVVFKRGMNLGDKYFLVEISLGHRVVFIDAHDVENPETYTLQMPIEEAVEIMGGEDKYEVLAGSLALEDGGIVLMDQRTPIHYENKNELEGEPILNPHSYHQSEPGLLEPAESEAEGMPDQQYLNRSYDHIHQDGTADVINFDSGDEEMHDGEIGINTQVQKKQLKEDEYVEIMRKNSQSLNDINQLQSEQSDYEESVRSKPYEQSEGELEDQLELQEEQELNGSLQDQKHETEAEEENFKRDHTEETDGKFSHSGFTKEIDEISEESLQEHSRDSSGNMKNHESASNVKHENSQKIKVKPSDLSIRSDRSDSRLEINQNLSKASSVRSKVSVVPDAIDQSMSKTSSVRSKVSVTPVGKNQSMSKPSSVKSKHSIRSDHFGEYKEEVINQTLSQVSVRSQNLDRSDEKEEKNTSRQSFTHERMSEKSHTSFKSLAKEEIKLNTSKDKFTASFEHRSQDLENSQLLEFSKHSSDQDLRKDQDLDVSNISKHSINLDISHKESLLKELDTSSYSLASNIRIDSRRDSQTSQTSKKSYQKETSQEILERNAVSQLKSPENERESDIETRFTGHIEDETYNQSSHSIIQAADSNKELNPQFSLEKVSDSDSKLNISKSSSNKGSLIESDFDTKLNLSKSSSRKSPLAESDSIHISESLKSDPYEDEAIVKKTIERLKTITSEEDKTTENGEIYTIQTIEASPVKKARGKTNLNVVAEINEEANESLGDLDKVIEYQNLSGIKASKIDKLDEAIEEPDSDEESSVNTSFLTESSDKSYEFPKVPIRTRIQQFDTIMSNKKTSIMMTESDRDIEELPK